MDELRPWLRSYPNGVPAEINPDEFNSLKELLEDSFQKNAGLTAFSNSGVAMRFEEVDQLSCHFAAYLLGRKTRAPEGLLRLRPPRGPRAGPGPRGTLQRGCVQAVCK